MIKRHLTEVQDWMSENVIVVAPDASLADAYALMIENEVRRLPVVDRELIGIITYSDMGASLKIHASMRPATAG